MTKKNSSSEKTFDLTVAELLQQIQQGDADLTGQLIENFRTYLLLIANQEVDPRLQAKLGASDVVQESILVAQQHINDFRGVSVEEFKGWLRGILTNKIRMARRHYFGSQKRDTGLEQTLNDSRQAPIRLDDPNYTPATNAVVEEEARMLRQAVSRLPEEYQRVLHLRNWQQMSFDDIAEQMNKTTDNVRKLWSRAFTRLQTEMRSMIAGTDDSRLS